MMDDWSLQEKLFGEFGAVLIAFAALSGYSMLRMARLAQRSVIEEDVAGAAATLGRLQELDAQVEASLATLSAVEEQTATTNEISRNIDEAASGSSQIAESITSVAQAAAETALGAAGELRTVAAGLQALVDGIGKVSPRPVEPARGGDGAQAAPATNGYDVFDRPLAGASNGHD